MENKEDNYGSLWDTDGNPNANNECFIPTYDTESEATLISEEIPLSEDESQREYRTSPKLSSKAGGKGEKTSKKSAFSKQGLSCYSFWNILGFDSNPLKAKLSIENDEARARTLRRNDSAADLRLSLLSNFSTSYNILSVSLAVHIMSNIYDPDQSDRTLCSSALLIGMPIGQLAGGALGDAIGRHRAMTFVMFLQVLSALGSALSFSCHLNSFWWPNESIGQFTIFKVLAVWRFILGLGCGGVYPLAATLSAESASFKENGAKLVALTFSMQGVGYLSVPVFAWILISTLGEDSDVTWRLLLGVGAVPGILLTIFRSMGRRKKQESLPSTNDGSMSLQDEFVQHHQLIVKPSILNAIRSEEHLFRKLVGTAGCWFIFDILFYGNTLFQPIVLEAVFGSSETLLKTARDSSLLAFMALPAYFICIAVLGKQTLSFIQIQGFLAMSVLYAIIGITFSSLSNNRPLLLLLYGATFFFSDYGPNTTTFMLPSMTFSPACRSTLNGVSAASGKLGALLGATMFEPAAKMFGDDVVMMICSSLSLMGAFMTYSCVQSSVGLITPCVKKEAAVSAYRKQSEPSLLDFQ